MFDTRKELLLVILACQWSSAKLYTLYVTTSQDKASKWSSFSFTTPSNFHPALYFYIFQQTKGYKREEKQNKKL